jgi:predicted NBD/HSP70 family sugar kinase
MRKVHRLEDLIFWHVFDRPSCLRNDLGHQFDISLATVSRAVSALLEQDLLIESSSEVPTPGRRPQSLRVNPKLAVLLGLDIQLDGVLAVITDVAGTLLGRGSVRCNAESGADAVVRAGLRAAQAALEDADIPRPEIRHLGVGHSGDLDIKNGVCVSWANAPSWKSIPIRDMLAAAFGVEVTIDDRSRALALAERRTSPMDWDHSEAIYVVCAFGVGMGFFVDGRLYRGASQGGGEIGHTIIDPNGPLCRCGSRGCLEAYAGTVAILRYVRDGLAAGAHSSLQSMPEGDLTFRTVVAAAHRGDELARAAIDRAAGALGTAVANSVQVLNPSLVVLCGELARGAGTEILEAVKRAVGSQCVETAARRVEIRLSRPKKDIAAIGCALLAAEAEAERVLRTRFS